MTRKFCFPTSFVNSPKVSYPTLDSYATRCRYLYGISYAHPLPKAFPVPHHFRFPPLESHYKHKQIHLVALQSRVDSRIDFLRSSSASLVDIGLMGSSAILLCCSDDAPA